MNAFGSAPNVQPVSDDMVKESEPVDPLVGVKALTGVYVGMHRKSFRRKRIRGDDGRSNVYHVMSRTCGGDVFFDDLEKEAFLIVLRKLARFSGIQILTFCIMGNHFHALVRVPHRPSWLESKFGLPGAAGGEARLLAHLGLLYSKTHVAALKAEWESMRQQGEGMARLVEERIEALKARMCNVSEWMREVKVRFSRWYNRRHERQGTLWMAPFKSVLVEARDRAGRRSNEHTEDIAKVMAACIDLNPVRAGLVERAEEYRWSGWSAALDGDKGAIAGLCAVMHCKPAEWLGYVKPLYGEKVSERRLSPGEEARPSSLLRHIPAMSKSLVVGSAAYFEEDYERSKEHYQRKRKALSIGSIAGVEVHALGTGFRGGGG
ncbi:MAG: hypothetical protein KDK97_11520 [Verrucomicrobiales bacterium]|nr:hypothetical protein [Verrucomicrobiales bacterium]MCP5559642.1 hypothetical protein [Verrucomicrobiaceae bacterium]